MKPFHDSRVVVVLAAYSVTQRRAVPKLLVSSTHCKDCSPLGFECVDCVHWPEAIASRVLDHHFLDPVISDMMMLGPVPSLPGSLCQTRAGSTGCVLTSCHKVHGTNAAACSSCCEDPTQASMQRPKPHVSQNAHITTTRLRSQNSGYHWIPKLAPTTTGQCI